MAEIHSKKQWLLASTQHKAMQLQGTMVMELPLLLHALITTRITTLMLGN
jgi:hypothetical protein